MKPGDIKPYRTFELRNTVASSQYRIAVPSREVLSTDGRTEELNLHWRSCYLQRCEPVHSLFARFAAHFDGRLQAAAEDRAFGFTENLARIIVA